MSCSFSSPEFEAQYTYSGNDLGSTWTPELTRFRVWAPTASAVSVRLYRQGTPGIDDLMEQLPMTQDVSGTWIAQKEGNCSGIYYTYAVTLSGQTAEACDPYARTTGVNGKRAMVLDLSSCNPVGWEKDRDPHAGKSFPDAVIYELHIRDLSMDESSGIQNRGKYLGVIETGTATKGGIPTGLDHIKSLGITHLHLLPVYDFGSVDECRPDVPQYNWGYDPVNFNVPEGSYCSDPTNGAVRVHEFKQMIKGLHDNGISVIMDVVYNHVYNPVTFCFNQIVPQYFTRINENGYSNGSGCGNDTASERSMVRKYIVDSVCYWADEYHIDGFRFDLVGLLDVETVNAITAAVHKKHPNVLFYGEGWTLNTVPTKDNVQLAVQANAHLTPDFSYFNDTVRDALRGSLFSPTEPGFVSGAVGIGETLEACFRGMPFWSVTPGQSINYVSCHDNNTLFDRIRISTPDRSFEDQVRMNQLAAAFCMTAQGVPFLQAGEEMLRSKVDDNGNFVSNSYRSSDQVNSLKWNTLRQPEYQQVFHYYQGLIAFRKAHAALRLTSYYDILSNIIPVPCADAHVGAFRIRGDAEGIPEEEFFLAFNAGNYQTELPLPEGKWQIYVNGDRAGTVPIGTVEGKLTLSPISAAVLIHREALTLPASLRRRLPAFLSGMALGAAAAVLLRRKKK